MRLAAFDISIGAAPSRLRIVSGGDSVDRVKWICAPFTLYFVLLVVDISDIHHEVVGPGLNRVLVLEDGLLGGQLATALHFDHIGLLDPGALDILRGGQCTSICMLSRMNLG